MWRSRDQISELPLFWIFWPYVNHIVDKTCKWLIISYMTILTQIKRNILIKRIFWNHVINPIKDISVFKIMKPLTNSTSIYNCNWFEIILFCNIRYTNYFSDYMWNLDTFQACLEMLRLIWNKDNWKLEFNKLLDFNIKTLTPLNFSFQME